MDIQAVKFDELPDFAPEKPWARILNKSKITMWRWRNESPPRIPFCRISNEVFYLKSDVLEFINRCRVAK